MGGGKRLLPARLRRLPEVPALGRESLSRQRGELRKLGKTQEATNTYRELLRNEKLANFSEAVEARKRLEALGQG